MDSRNPFGVPPDVSGPPTVSTSAYRKPGAPDAAAAVVTERSRRQHHEPMALQRRIRRRRRRGCSGRHPPSACLRSSTQCRDANEVHRSAADPARRCTVGAGSLRHDDDAGNDTVQQPVARDACLGIRRRLSRADDRGDDRPADHRHLDQQPADRTPARAVHRLHARRSDAGTGRAGGDTPARRPRGAGQRRRPRRVVFARSAENVLVSERPGRGDALVPRPRDGHHPPQPVRGSGRLLHRPGRVRGLTQPAEGRVRDPARDPGQAVQHRRDADLSRPGNHAPGVAAGDVRRRDRRQRQALAVSERRTAKVPHPHPQRLEREVLLAQDRRAEEGNEVQAAVQPDRRRRRAVPANHDNDASADRTRRARRRDRRLRQRRGHDADHEEQRQGPLPKR